MLRHSSLILYVDGASKGNPGPSGIGVVIYDDKGRLIKRIKKNIGQTTNNIAEYTALVYALQEALMLQAKQVAVYTDSELMHYQITGSYKVKSQNLKPLHQLLLHLKDGFESFEVKHINREKNKEADALASDAASPSELFDI